MFTLKIEVESKVIETACQHGYYTPAVDWSTKYPRTQAGLVKALAAMKKQADKEDWLEDYRFKVYEGKVYHYTKEPKLLGVISKDMEALV